MYFYLSLRIDLPQDQAGLKLAGLKHLRQVVLKSSLGINQLRAVDPREKPLKVKNETHSKKQREKPMPERL